jgi:hypothetical protein
MNDKQIKKMTDKVLGDIENALELEIEGTVYDYIENKIELTIRIAEKEGMKEIMGDFEKAFKPKKEKK